jgi:hypothetical protein
MKNTVPRGTARALFAAMCPAGRGHLHRPHLALHIEVRRRCARADPRPRRLREGRRRKREQAVAAQRVFVRDMSSLIRVCRLPERQPWATGRFRVGFAKRPVSGVTHPDVKAAWESGQHGGAIRGDGLCRHRFHDPP